MIFESQPPCPDQPDYRCFSRDERVKIKELERGQNITHQMLEDMIIGLKRPRTSRACSSGT